MQKEGRHTIQCSQCIYRNQCEKEMVYINQGENSKVRIPIQGCERGISIDEAAGILSTGGEKAGMLKK